jgi:hypothetical protein
MEPLGVDSFMVSFTETESMLGNYYLGRPKLMLFDANEMEEVWTSQSADSLINYFNYSIAKTSDGGYVSCGKYIAPYGYEFAYLQKWSYNGEEMWSRSYRHFEQPSDSIADDQAFWDITEAPDSGLIACGYYNNGQSDPQHAWVLKLDGCGDPVFDSCVVVYDGVWTGKNIPALNNLFVWPNPFQNHLNIQLKEHSAIVDILDVMGNLVYTKMSYQLLTKFDLSEIPTGVYLVKARMESGLEITKRVVKVE